MDSLIATIISAALLGDVELLFTVRSSDFNNLIAFFACLSNSDFLPVLFSYHCFQFMWVKNHVQYFSCISRFDFIPIEDISIFL